MIVETPNETSVPLGLDQWEPEKFWVAGVVLINPPKSVSEATYCSCHDCRESAELVRARTLSSGRYRPLFDDVREMSLSEVISLAQELSFVYEVRIKHFGVVVAVYPV